MARLLQLCVLSLMLAASAKAQEPAICGDWVGVFKMWDRLDELDEDGDHRMGYVDYKAYLRIKLIDGNYTVRMKTRIADESKPFVYKPECRVEQADEHAITWVFDHGNDYDWDASSKEQGIRIGHSHDITRCTVTLDGGVLHYTDQFISAYYDVQGRPINTKRWEGGKNYNLYKDDNDW